MRCSFRGTLRLRRSARSPTIAARVVGNTLHPPIVNPLRFSETINGRSYEIEVQHVGVDRWRAFLARAGAPTALMPFYGGTPDEAARQLAGWLTRASRPAKPV